ncbi:MAG: PAS domain-containing sensor histidine kinase, partial [Bacteroidota bacterium]|nr:PAS domain-containing sensor histidine kinase [Bacteroidota bacterium]
FKSSPIGMVLVDPETFVIQEANPAFAGLMGLSEREMSNGPMWDDHTICDPDQWAALKNELATAGKLTHRELRIAVAKDDGIDLLLHATHVAFGERRSILFHVENITEIKAAFQALKEADRRKDEFIATFSHELRNPLAPLSNAMQLLDFGSDDPAIIEQARGIMGRQLKHMVHLLDDLLDLSRVSRGVIVLRRTALDLKSVLLESIEASRSLIDHDHHELKIELDERPIWVNGDNTRLVQIFNNLLNNASKYTEPGGKIHLKCTSSGGNARITVSDNGIGIEPIQLEKVFDMFAQLEPAISKEQSGLGIGLSIVKQLVLMHGGKISAFSKGKGHGSEFTVELPLIDHKGGYPVFSE